MFCRLSICYTVRAGNVRSIVAGARHAGNVREEYFGCRTCSYEDVLRSCGVSFDDCIKLIQQMCPRTDILRKDENDNQICLLGTGACFLGHHTCGSLIDGDFKQIFRRARKDFI
jgi:hypothetical protein